MPKGISYHSNSISPNPTLTHTCVQVLSIAATGYGLKFALAAALTPLLYLVKNVMSERFGLEAIPADPDAQE